MIRHRCTTTVPRPASHRHVERRLDPFELLAIDGDNIEPARRRRGELHQVALRGIDDADHAEHRVSDDGTTRAAGEVFGYHVITTQYYERYKIPVMHTETNLKQGPNGDEAVNWLWKEWSNVMRVRNDGVPIVGFTWYSLTDQVDWDTALREDNNNVNPLGLFDLNRNIRPVGEAYKKLINDWREVLPTNSVCLNLPIQIPFSNKVTQNANMNSEKAEENKKDPQTLLQAGKN